MIPDTVFTLDKAKAHLRVTHALEDALITAMLDGAVAECERLTRRAWTERTWTTPFDACDLGPCGCDSAVFHAELSPATVKIFTTDPSNPPPAETEWTPANYFLAIRFGHTVVVPVEPTPPTSPEGAVGRIEWTAKPINDVVPPDVYAAAMLYLGDLYENREAQLTGIMVTPNAQAERLLRSYVIELRV